MSEDLKNPDRRAFFRKAGLGAGVAAAAAVSASAASADGKVDGAESKLGYQETEHVKTYYDLARF